MNLHAKRRSSNQQGVILLVVLGSLTFFSILVAAYLVFSNESRDASFAQSQRDIREPDVDWMMNEALMTLVRGTQDTSNPFYGEDLLSDYYGLKDGFEGAVFDVDQTGIPRGFLRFELRVPATAMPLPFPVIDDFYAGRLLTFRAGPLRNRTYRVIRSEYNDASSTQAIRSDFLLVQLQGTEPSLASNSPAAAWFPDAISRTVWLNGAPRNSVGVGFNPATFAFDPVSPDFYAGLAGLPAAFQPNHLNGVVPYNKSLTGGDTDEDYDAADFNNWFLSHRREDGTVIPSFHRPSLINYLLNQKPSLDTVQNFPDLLSSIRRATFRPLPLASGALGNNPSPINSRFTGGNANYALRTPIQSNNLARLHQLAGALINGQWDVDNDSDGKTDSVWVNLGLPTFVTQEGKLIQPLVAPMIEDLGGRLNLNAHGNSEIKNSNGVAAVQRNSQVAWAGQPNSTAPLNRGSGWGPAEINLPQTAGADDADGLLLRDLIDRRYANPAGVRATTDAGVAGRDPLDVLSSGFRPPFHSAVSGFGGTTDPFGRAATGLGRSGHVLAAPQNVTNPPREDVNHPYELDPTGALSGDSIFTTNDLEAILRADDFDSELLPSDLRQRLITLVRDHQDYRHSFTTKSTSDDSPISLILNFAFLRQAGQVLDASQLDMTSPNDHAEIQTRYENLFPPELRLGRKLDVNRAIGNRVDDNNNSVIDEPSEVVAETEAFRIAANATGSVPNAFTGLVPSYTWDDAAVAGQIPVTGRQLLARHLYVLAMLVRHELNPPYGTASLATVSNYNQAEQELYTARRLAQWAVNVVDYRDPDSIMTRFAFDPDPFNADGWTVNDTFAAPQDSRYVVWGVEEPQLMFSEGLAVHDVRVRDTKHDSTGEFKKEDKPNPVDETTDQVRIPQGSLFLELYCPHPTINNDEATKPGFPMELYQQSPSGPQLNLSASAPRLNAVAPYGAPVWRIAISERHDAQAAANRSDLAPRLLAESSPDSASFEVNQPDELEAPIANPLALERFILFTNAQDIDTDPDAAFNQIDNVISGNQITDMAASQVFIAPSFANDASINADRLLEPGQFLVLAPRLTTHFGSGFDFGNGNGNAGGNGNGNAFGLINRLTPAGPSDQLIRIENLNGFQQLGHYGIANANNDDVGDRATPVLSVAGQGAVFGARALPLVIAAPRRTGWPAAIYETGAVGLNISEPLPRGLSYYTQPSARYFGNQQFPDGSEYLLTDAYLDFQNTNDTALDLPSDGNFDFIPMIGSEPSLGTIENYRSAFLQRLADPTLPYNAVTNPYRTVDWFQLDLTVFSGEEREDFVTENVRANYARRSRQRNGQIRYPSDLNNPVRANALYSYQSESGSVNSNIDTAGFTAGASGHYFKFESAGGGDDGKLHNSLSFLNCNHDNVNPGFQGYGLPLGSLVTGMDANLPQIPYAVHPWLNRPFATPYELMMVPASSAGRLFEEFNVVNGGSPTEVYADPNSGATTVMVTQAPFRHLLNFFHSGNVNGDGLELSRIFEFIHTAPRFKGEVEYLDYTTRLASLPPAVQTLLKPPFNILYDNQRQGMVNLNSISSFPVWAGLMQGHLNTNEFTQASPNGPFDSLGYNRFRANRRGFAGSNSVVRVTDNGASPGSYNYDPKLSQRFPTQFAGVFKSSLMTPFAPADNLRRSGVNGTMMRDDVSVESASPTQKPFFVRPDLFPPATLDPASNRFASPWMRYQTLMRMPNLASNNSQVFLLRMTLGFFEVDASTGELGREYNADAGRSERYQAMFVIDRSIPVGFQPGKDLNARDVVIFESYGQ